MAVDQGLKAAHDWAWHHQQLSKPATNGATPQSAPAHSAAQHAQPAGTAENGAQPLPDAAARAQPQENGAAGPGPVQRSQAATPAHGMDGGGGSDSQSHAAGRHPEQAAMQREARADNGAAAASALDGITGAVRGDADQTAGGVHARATDASERGGGHRTGPVHGGEQGHAAPAVPRPAARERRVQRAKQGQTDMDELAVFDELQTKEPGLASALQQVYGVFGEALLSWLPLGDLAEVAV